MRAKTCVRLKKRWDSKFESHEDCVKLVRKICNPGEDLKMNGEPFETPTGEGFCQAFFGHGPYLVEECIALSKKGGQQMSLKEHDRYRSCKELMNGLCKKQSEDSNNANEKLMDHKEL